MCECGNRYCQEAVDSLEIVTSCPTSKIDWEIAAGKKNCEKKASRQNCDSLERLKYHCVINGFRNELVEVCAPSRIIFGKMKNELQRKYKFMYVHLVYNFGLLIGNRFTLCLLFNVFQDIVQSLMFMVE